MSNEQLTPTNEANQEEIPSYPFPFADHSLQLPEEYDRLRQQCPVARVHMPYGGDAFLPTRYELIGQAFADPRCAAVKASDGAVPRLEAGAVTGTEERSEMGEIFTVSAARHTKLRRVISSAFSVPAANKLRPRVVEVTQALIDAMERSGPPADLFEDYAIQVPMTVLCEMLGIPREEEPLPRISADHDLDDGSPRRKTGAGHEADAAFHADHQAGANQSGRQRAGSACQSPTARGRGDDGDRNVWVWHGRDCGGL